MACGPKTSDSTESPVAQAAIPEQQPIIQASLSSEEYSERGRAAASPDFPGLAPLCGDPSPELTYERVTSRPYKMPDGLPPAKVFDNLYFLGNTFVSAWAIETSEGIILIDALWHPLEAEKFIEGGLRSLGLDPADIKIMVLSHGHGDHTGGAKFLHDKYGMQVIMGKADWAYLNGPDNAFDLPGWNDVPTPDILVSDRETVTLGDTSIQIVSTPGHTMGTVSTILPVINSEKSHTAVIWGGTGYNFGPKLDQYMAYANSADQMRDEVLSTEIDVFMSNHVRRDSSDKKMQLLETRSPEQPHPFVLGAERTSKAFEVFRDCALSQAAKLTENR